MSEFRYWEQVEQIKQLRRDGHTIRAEALLIKCVEAIEASSQAPAPWYFEQLAIMATKAGDFRREAAILSRYVEACRSHGEPPIEKLVMRLTKASDRASANLR